jgi:hypothetical protein
MPLCGGMAGDSNVNLRLLIIYSSRRASFMKIKRVILIVIIITIIFIPIFLYYTGESNRSRESDFEVNWNINIPSDFEMIYNKNNQHGFEADGSRYSIYIIKDTSTFSLPLISLKNNKKKIQTIEGSSSDDISDDIEEFAKTITSDLNISENYKPKFDEYYNWQKFVKFGGTLIIVYFPNVNKVFFIEKLI